MYSITIGAFCTFPEVSESSHRRSWVKKMGLPRERKHTRRGRLQQQTKRPQPGGGGKGPSAEKENPQGSTAAPKRPQPGGKTGLPRYLVEANPQGSTAAQERPQPRGGLGGHWLRRGTRSTRSQIRTDSGVDAKNTDPQPFGKIKGYTWDEKSILCLSTMSRRCAITQHSCVSFFSPSYETRMNADKMWNRQKIPSDLAPY